MPESLIGKVARYDSSGVAVLKLDQPLYADDWIHIVGHTTNLEQLVEDLRIDNRDVLVADPGNEVTVKVSSRVSVGDEVYRETYIDEEN